MNIEKQSSTKQRVIFAGTPEFAAISLQALIEQQQALNIEIVAVYTQPDRKAGRGQKLTASPVKQLALEHNLPVEQPLTFQKSVEEGQAARETLANYQPDIMVVAAYGLILPIGVLETPTHGCLNIHASLLPRWRGAAPIHRALLAGDEQTGITIMQMDKGLDTGDMLYKVAYNIAADETTASLHDKMAELGAEAIVTVLKDLSWYQAKAEKQDDSLANYAEKLSKSEGEIDWTQSAELIERQIRGMHPYPGAYTFLADSEGKGEPKRVKVLAALPVNHSQTTVVEPGTVISVGKNAILVACGQSNSDSNAEGTTLRLTQLQFAGSKPVTAEQVCHGSQLDDGDKFVATAK
ncbi:methionyl-tRNA formyltransferase [Psychrobacter sanguinis]|uniref:methionyl-tRNA formyltransferase n=1 Tax=Psychrobacter sanguinis TaxID=861445 RepID=UPI002A7563A0|nr:methionyl-tRNA formyltransferase [Psychrobacter sanguinis]MDY3305944.1 methionyl-tRNA formyltransferase [Psychrobacter sanguinis]